MNTFTQMAAEWIRQNYVQNAPAPKLLADDLAAWRVPFRAWLEAQCVVKDRCFGGIGCLHVRFAQWCAGYNAKPCTRPTFERLLTGSGYLMADGLVSGLILREDWEACGDGSRQYYRDTPIPSTSAHRLWSARTSPCVCRFAVLRA